jgi:hypothetical protein
MLKKQYHEMNQDNLKIKTRIKKVRKEHEKVAREVKVMKEIREEGQLDSLENQERRRKMLLETEWKQKIKKKGQEIEKVMARLKNVRKEMKNENLRHLEKELKFYSNLNRNLMKEVREREGQLNGKKEEIRRELMSKKKEVENKEKQVQELKERHKELMADKYEVKKEFNQLILDEEMKMEGMAKKIKKKPRKINEAERVERLQLKETIKKQIEDIQNTEEQHRKIFEKDKDVESLQGLHYTKKNEILLNIDCETEMDEDVLFYLKGGRNLELFFELEGIAKDYFLKNMKNALKHTVHKDEFKKEILVKKLSEKKYGKLPRVLGKIVADVAETVVMSNMTQKEKKNKKMKINKKKKMLEMIEHTVHKYFKTNLQYKIFYKRGGEKHETNFLKNLKKTQKKLESLKFEENEESQGEEAWIRYMLIMNKGLSPEEASLIIGSAFWNTKDCEDIQVEELKRYVKKYVEYLEKKARRRQKEKEQRELEDAAIKIQSVFKGKKARKMVKELKKRLSEDNVIEEEKVEEIPEEISGEIKEEEVVEEIEEDIKEVKEEDDIDWEKEEEKAALLIQGKFRQKQAKKKVDQLRQEKKKEEEKEQEQAAILIQGRFRQKQAKKILEQKKKEREEEEAAATLIQKRYKQKMAKRKLSQGTHP